MKDGIFYDVEKVIEQLKPYVKNNYFAFSKIKDRGNNIMCCCPYHEDSSPSFGIQKEPPYAFHCFGCGVSGTVEKLIIDITGINCIYDFISPHIKSEKYKIDVLKLFNEEKRRGVGIEFDKYRGKYPKALLIRGISPYVLDKYEVYYNGTDIVIPVRDEFGIVRFIKSRKLLDKYYTNSGNKKSILYGLYYLINSSKKFREVYITEGEFDTMACYQAGLPAVSTMGNVLFREQLSLLYKYFSTVNIFFDNDKAGKIGTYNAMNLIVKEKSPIKVNLIKYPDDSCKDPNELLSGNKIDKIEKISAMVSKFL